ncbi:ubiquinol-cytochrome C chaperone family protein [Polymorphobacter sp.]|uniref:ubiquinol-cytochrome C chaperone family protein n=1 Tax=Polymorphobacter sp. TaxID=1909290 RepID=UPI003F730634
MSLFSALRRLIGASPAALPGNALYAGVVAEARRQDWYLAGEVPDTMDGRFDMVALVLSLLLMRLEREDSASARQLAADVTDRFITDMDGNLRQDGVGDQVVGKHLGRMMAALGGRLGAYRDAGDDDAAFGAALAKNIWRGSPVDEPALAYLVAEARRLAARLATMPEAALASGAWPAR